MSSPHPSRSVRTVDDLRWIFQDLEPVEVRPMRAQDQSSPWFGQPFLLTALFRRPEILR